MDENNCSFARQSYQQLVTDFDQVNGVMWCYVNPSPRPCFTPELLRDLKKFLYVVQNRVNSEISSGLKQSIHYLILGSYMPGIFSLGGDLELFISCIKENDIEKLRQYMKLSIDVLFGTFTNMDLPITTIALIRGNALGAGFEGALACDYLIAEKNVQLGFPEVLFNMFPGMGAYSFLSRRLSRVDIEKMILSGRIYSAEELHEMGVIDYLAENGQGVLEVKNVIKKHQKTSITHKSIIKIRNRVNPVSYAELIDIGNLWVDAAMSLSEREIKIMQRLVRSQNRLMESLSNTVDVQEKIANFK